VAPSVMLPPAALAARTWPDKLSPSKKPSSPPFFLHFAYQIYTVHIPKDPVFKMVSIDELTIDHVHSDFKNGAYTCRQLVEATLNGSRA
jgi:hypothetical protein